MAGGVGGLAAAHKRDRSCPGCRKYTSTQPVLLRQRSLSQGTKLIRDVLSPFSLVCSMDTTFTWRRCVCKPHHFGSGLSDLHLRHLQDSQTESLGLNAQCAQRGIRGGLKHPHLEGYEPRLHVACNGYGKRHSPHWNCQGKVRNCAAWSRGTA